MTTELTVARLRELLHYDPLSGIFTWKVHRGGKAQIGSAAGTPNGRGYIRICIDGKIYMAHRLGWLYTYGEWPEDKIDHVNRMRDGNMIRNLRQANNIENSRNRTVPLNNSSGCPGVALHRKGQWRAYIKVEGQRIHLGVYKDINAAISARHAAEVKYFGDYRRSA